MTVPDVFEIAGFTGRGEWFGFRFTQTFRDPTTGQSYWVSLLWFVASNDGRMEGPFPEDSDGKRAVNVPLSVVYYACAQVRGLMEALEAMGDEEPAQAEGDAPAAEPNPEDLA